MAPAQREQPAPAPASVRPRRVAAAALGVQALAMLAVAAWQEGGVLAGEASSPQVATGSAAYFAVFGVVVAVFAGLALKGTGWVYGPTVFLQVLALPLAATMAAERLWWGALLLGGVAVGALVVLLAPTGRAAFGRP